MSREPVLAPKERFDTSIARQGYDHRDTAPQGLKDRRIFARPNIRPLSTRLSDLLMMTFWFHNLSTHNLSTHSLSLRFRLCWYRIGLSALVYRIDQLAPKERFDTSIARQGYACRIFPFVTANLLMNPRI